MIAKHHNVDLIITDLLMPGLSGIDVLVQAKQIQPRVEVLVITASQSIESAVVAIKKGARDYLTKPIQPSSLVIRVRAVLRRVGVHNTWPGS